MESDDEDEPETNDEEIRAMMDEMRYTHQEIADELDVDIDRVKQVRDDVLDQFRCEDDD